MVEMRREERKELVELQRREQRFKASTSVPEGGGGGKWKGYLDEVQTEWSQRRRQLADYTGFRMGKRVYESDACTLPWEATAHPVCTQKYLLWESTRGAPIQGFCLAGQLPFG